jgi:peptidoglycan/LPS O-acetylase OafA/YrhL
MSGSSGKDANLEALRGLAALVVLGWHCLLGFYPDASGHWSLAHSLKGEPWFALLNGPAAVTLFFVLSGYVLTRRYMLGGESGLLVRGAIKRWPRLVGPVLVVVMISWAMFALGLHAFREAAVVSSSPWLATYGYGLDPETFAPNFWDAFAQGSVRTFLFREASYNSSLWTMQIEMMGSLAVFAVAAPVRYLRAYSRVAAAVLLVAAFAVLGLVFPLARAFIAGLALAAFIPPAGILMNRWGALCAAAIAVYLLGYSGAATGAFVPIARLGIDPYDTATAGAAILVLVASRPGAALLPHALSMLIGRLSFPIYLVQVPVICSVGAATFLLCEEVVGPDLSAAVAISASTMATLLAALPLARFNDWWVERVNAATQSALVVPRRGTSGAQRSGPDRQREISAGVRRG